MAKNYREILRREGRLLAARAEASKVALHLDLNSLEQAAGAKVRPKRLVLTHMSDHMLGRLPDVTYETARDSMIIELPSI